MRCHLHNLRCWLAEPLPRWAVLLAFVIPAIGQAVVADRAQRRDDDLAVATRASARAAYQAKAAIRQIARESRERRNQTCLRDENQHLRDVRNLRLTYRYLVTLTAAQRAEPLNALIVRQLPRSEADAKDQAPAFCDEPGVEAERKGAPPIGRREPDPVIPRRPRGLR